MHIVEIIREEIQNQDAQQYIDIIDLNPDDPKYSKYIDVLRNKYGVEYQRPEIRYSEDMEFINGVADINKDIRTTGGLELNISTEKISGLPRSLQVVAKLNGNTVGRAGFGVDINNNELRIGGAQVMPEYQRQGVYSAIVDVIEEIAEKRGLKILETGRSNDAQQFWKNRHP